MPRRSDQLGGERQLWAVLADEADWTEGGGLALVGPAADVGTAQIACFAKLSKCPKPTFCLAKHTLVQFA